MKKAIFAALFLTAMSVMCVEASPPKFEPNGSELIITAQDSVSVDFTITAYEPCAYLTVTMEQPTTFVHFAKSDAVLPVNVSPLICYSHKRWCSCRSELYASTHRFYSGNIDSFIRADSKN